MSEKFRVNPPESTAATTGSRRNAPALDPAIEYVRQAMIGMQFGQVAIIVQDGVIVQIDRTERRRFRRGENRIKHS